MFHAVAALRSSDRSILTTLVLFGVLTLSCAACSDTKEAGGSQADTAAATDAGGSMDATDVASAQDTAGAEDTGDAGASSDGSADDAVADTGDVTAKQDMGQADTKVAFPNSCVCTSNGCGGGAIGGDQGDVFTDVSDTAIGVNFKPTDSTGWTCLAAKLTAIGGDGSMACYCADGCGSGGTNSDKGDIHLKLTKADVDKSYGGGAQGNATGWLCGVDRGPWGK